MAPDEQLNAYAETVELDRQFREVRNQAIEECAHECEAHISWLSNHGANGEKMRTAATLADKIRALKTTP